MTKKYKILIALGVAIFLVCSGVAYSVFNSKVDLTATKDIAKFIFNAESLDQLQVPLIDLKPGDEQEYPFAVSNNSSGKVSNVSLRYQMTVKTYHLMPLTIELYRLNGETEELILTCDETHARNPQNELICDTPVQEMGYSSEKVDNYKLKVSFSQEYNDTTFANLVDYIDIEIKSWQKI